MVTARSIETAPLEMLYILFRFDRVVTMSEDEKLSDKFLALVSELDYTARYHTLYRPTITFEELYAMLSMHSGLLPRELVGLVVDYCRLDVLSVEDEEFIIKRILS